MLGRVKTAEAMRARAFVGQNKECVAVIFSQLAGAVSHGRMSQNDTASRPVSCLNVRDIALRLSTLSSALDVMFRTACCRCPFPRPVH